MNSQFSLALELLNVFPIRGAIDSAASQLLKFARDLQRSSSDIVVEEDLAAIFGRGRINVELEDKFKNTVKVQTFTPLSHGSNVRLDSGPGPTLHRALSERRYLATVIQLSLLAWMQNRDKLAAMLTTCMQRRIETGVHEASNPGFEGVCNTLAACSSQCSSFTWSFYVEQMEDKLRCSLPGYRFHDDYIRILESLLLGAMDYLYLVQSLPEHRKILISSQVGCMIIIVWAHCILGSTVAIAKAKGLANMIIFGEDKDPHVIITWQECRSDHADDTYSNFITKCRNEKPSIRLLDQDMMVVLRSIPEEEQESHQLMASGQDRHPLLGYGTVCLHRRFNSSAIIAEKHPVYAESAKLITAIAVHISNRLNRRMDHNLRGEEFESLPQYKIKTELWRFLAAGKIIFDGIKLDPAGVDMYVRYYDDLVLDEHNLPKSFHSILNTATQCDSSLPQAKGLFKTLERLAKVVLLFGNVANVEDCAEMPIILDRTYLEFQTEVSRICKNPRARVSIAPETIFYGIAQLMADGLVYKTGRFDPQQYAEITFLFSDFGWSVFLDTVGDKDPAAVKPHHVHVSKSVPTNVKTNERRPLIIDGLINFTPDFPRVYKVPPAQTGLSIPRAVAEVTHRMEYWITGSREFEMSIIMVVEPGKDSELHQFDFQPIKDWTYHRYMHEQIWETFTTPACDHQPEARPKKPLNLGPEAVAILGWSTGEAMHGGPYTQRILIFLIRGDSRVRWLAVRNATGLGTPIGSEAPEPSDKSEVMLRTLDCCDECALNHASALPGKWILIL